MSRKTILFLSWRDIKNPKSGGAEVYTHEVLRRLVQKGHQIVHISPIFAKGQKEERIDGVLYLRRGSNISVIAQAMKYYLSHRKEISLVIDQCNTHRFFTPLWLPHSKRAFFIHQMTREIWFEMMAPHKALCGVLFEAFALKLNSKDRTITVSQSTRNDLLEAGFRAENLVIAPEGLIFTPWNKENFLEKDAYTFLYAGRINQYKGVETAIRTIAHLRKEGYPCRLRIVGRGEKEYINTVLKPLIQELRLHYSEGGDDPQTSNIHFFGFVSDDELKNLMSRSLALLFASSREGWGLTVSESAIFGTPSIVWPSAGLVDAVNFGQAGYLCKYRTVESMVEQAKRILDNPEEYQEKRMEAYRFACTLNFDRSAEVFDQCISKWAS